MLILATEDVVISFLSDNLEGGYPADTLLSFEAFLEHLWYFANTIRQKFGSQY
jgi:hypothetical protein